MKIVHTISRYCILVVFAVALGACSSRAINDADRTSVSRMIPSTKSNLSVLVVRGSFDGDDCNALFKLRPVKNGMIDTSQAVYVNRALAPTGEEFGREIGNLARLQLGEVRKDADIRALKSQLTSIAPGEYLVTYATCAVGNKIVKLGSDYSDVFNKPVAAPVLGDNYIKVLPGQVLDAGVLQIQTTRQDGWFTKGQGRLVAYDAPEIRRQYLRDNFPDVYDRLSFGRFSAYHGTPAHR